MKQIYQELGGWYKGNLHTHTTLSDGNQPPEVVCEMYAKAGYDFLALTDHRKPGECGMYGNMRLLPGVEWDTGDNDRKPVYHILGIGMTRATDPAIAESYSLGISLSPQQIIDAINAAGGIAILAHPHWSVMDPNEMFGLHGLAGAEIYNTISGLPWNGRRADASLYFDLWASRGLYVPAFAADDAHWYGGDQTKSYILVNAASSSMEDLMQAIRMGNFYASQGPRFRSLTLRDDDTIEAVVSEDVEDVVFVSNMAWSGHRVQKVRDGRVLYRREPGERYIRVELIAGNGLMAFSSPIPWS